MYGAPHECPENDGGKGLALPGDPVGVLSGARGTILAIDVAMVAIPGAQSRALGTVCP